MRDFLNSITFLNQIPTNTLMIVMIVTGVLLLFLFLKFSVPTKWIVRVILATLRLFLLGMILFLILDPFWKQAAEKETIGVLLDTSPSMKVIDEHHSLSRFELLQEYFASNEDWLSHELDLVQKMYQADDSVRAMGALKEARLSGKRSHLIRAVKQIDNQFQNDSDLLGWFLFSDGNATDLDDFDLSEQFGSLNFPWVTVQVAGNKEVPNLFLSEVDIPQRVFSGEVMPITVEWETNIEGEHETQFVVKVNGEIHINEKVSLGEQVFEGELLIEEPGAYAIDVEMKGLKGEGSLRDNRIRTWVEIEKRVVKVLYIEAFYKNENLFKKALEEDAAFVVDFSSSLIGFARERQVPFIQDPQYGFPRTKDELLKYDAVVLSDVKRKLLTDQQILWIKELVEEKGGALVMIGGVDSFGDGGYVGTEIEKMLPVEVSEDYKQDSFLAARGTTENEFVPLLNSDQVEHPLAQITGDAEKDRALWKNIPKLGGYNYVGRLKPAASLILQHPVDKSTFGPRIILAEQKFGRGRVLAFTSDVTYNWGQWFQAWRNENEEWVFARFWQNAMKWLTENRLEERVAPIEIHLSEKWVEEGEPHQWKISFPYGVEASGESSLRLEIFKGKEVVKSYEIEEIFNEEPIHWKIESLLQGDYILKAHYLRPESKPTVITLHFSVQDVLEEARHLDGHSQVLQELANLSGGMSYSLEEPEKFLEALDRLRRSHIRQHSQPFWSQPWIFVLILFILVLDWGIRKKAGTE